MKSLTMGIFANVYSKLLEHGINEPQILKNCKTFCSEIMAHRWSLATGINGIHTYCNENTPKKRQLLKKKLSTFLKGPKIYSSIEYDLESV